MEAKAFHRDIRALLGIMQGVHMRYSYPNLSSVRSLGPDRGVVLRVSMLEKESAKRDRWPRVEGWINPKPPWGMGFRRLGGFGFVWPRAKVHAPLSMARLMPLTVVVCKSIPQGSKYQISYTLPKNHLQNYYPKSKYRIIIYPPKESPTKLSS